MNKKQITFVILSSLIIGGIGGWLFDRFLIPRINTIPFLVKYNLAPQAAPLVINRKEEIRVNEGSDSIAAIQQVQPWMVGILTGNDVAHAQVVGSGVTLTSDGLIAVSKASLQFAQNGELTFSFNDGTIFKGNVVAQDPASNLAFVKVAKNNLTTASLGHPKDLQLGQRIIVITPSLNEYQPAGNVSFLSETVKNTSDKTFSSDLANQPFKVDGLKDVFEGAVVLSLDDNVQGIYASSEVVTADTIRSAMNSYFANGKIIRNQFGFNYAVISSLLSNAFGTAQGVQVRNITIGSPAAKAGLQQNDVITALDGNRITADNSFQDLAQKYKSGDSVKLSITRNQQPLTLTLVVASK